MSRPIDLLSDARELRRAGAQPQLGTGSGHPILAGYGFLQAPDVAVHLESLPEYAGAVRAVQSDLLGASDMFATREIAEQLEHVRKLRFRKSELVWLAGDTFYGRRGIFKPAFMEWLGED